MKYPGICHWSKKCGTFGVNLIFRRKNTICPAGVYAPCILRHLVCLILDSALCWKKRFNTLRCICLLLPFIESSVGGVLRLYDMVHSLVPVHDTKSSLTQGLDFQLIFIHVDHKLKVLSYTKSTFLHQHSGPFARDL